MARLVALEGRGAGRGIPVLGPATYLDVGPDGRVRLAHGGAAPRRGAVIRPAARGGFEVEVLGGAATSLLALNGAAPRGVSALRHGDVLVLADQSLLFDAEGDDGGESEERAPARPEASPAAVSAAPARPAPAGPASASPAATSPAAAPAPRGLAAPARGATADDGLDDDAPLEGGDSIVYRRKAYEDAREVARGPATAAAAGGAPEAARLAVLLRAAAALQASLELEATLGALLDQLFEAVPAARGAILLVDPERGKLRQATGKLRGEAPARDARVPVSRTLLREAVRAREAVLTANALADPRFLAGEESIAAAGIRSAIVAPIIQQGRLLGVVQLSSAATARPFTREDLELAAAIAGLGALAVDNARLHKELLERERLRQEVELARSVQRHLLPVARPPVAGLEVYGMTRPAKELGGDLLDFVPAPGGSLHILVGDVSGKGIGAGLIMAMARSYFRALVGGVEPGGPGAASGASGAAAGASAAAPAGADAGGPAGRPDAAPAAPSPRRVIADLNRLLHRDTEADKFMSAIHVLWDAERQALRYCGAGQEHLIVRRAADGACEAIRAGGVALAVLAEAGAFYEEKPLALAPGDVVLLYTDGVTETRDPAGAFFGLDRLIAALAGPAGAAGSAEAVAEGVLAAVDAFGGRAEAHDDLTLVVLRRPLAPPRAPPPAASPAPSLRDRVTEDAE